ncbi:TPA: choline-binding protein CbpF [Streptococcus pneumoniae]|uniref:choline-binding protein CbpF n=1 Tax=Streptococcus pneumoniae TaxID=1313 RepID=UPI00020A911C|nr:choline-binding protein CbpF [Streptococcus pneumoniae]EGJ16368.1 choline-binding protein F [Streptococcus pneumoniae GA41317]EHZ72040.1 choline-binding protein F [Streptococcus pneumoniae GA49194]EHZ93085.1 choline-binding protein F [Streptococcus pneumoniae EU-NP03]MBW7495578.1 choline-binding protein CbpF [Streptococcus pneumoniae]MBW7553888.1 choline-binding protein CbpF [Streptococcus pneumoniae]
MKLFKKMMQVVLATFFFGLLGTSTVFADDSEGWQFVQENGRTYYKKGDLKETYWRVIDGKYYYFDPLSGEMVVGWQYIPAPHKGVTIGPSPRIEIALRPDWFYFGQDGVLQEFVGKQVLEAKTATNTNKHHGEEYDSPAEKRVYYFEDQRSYHTLKTGWIYEEGHWYYLQKDGGFDSRINRLTVGELARGWVKDYPLTYDEEKLKAAPWYYLDPATGIMQTGWQYLGNKWYYLHSSGAMATGWYKEGSTWYYLDAENGDMRTGWQNLGNKWYYLRSSGAMATGWYQEGSTWYYLNASNGDMKTGWFQVNGNWYYAYDSGALAVNTTVGGYYLNYNGEWVK